MSFENTLNRFRLISGLEDSEIAVRLPLLSEAEDYVLSLAKSAEPSEKEVNRLSSAAAVYAYYRMQCCNIDDESSFKTGDVTVNYNSERIAQAERMWEKELEAIADIADVSRAAGFLFKAVQ